MEISLWLHHFGGGAGCAAAVEACLGQARVDVRPFPAGNTTGAGIVVFSTFRPELCEFVRTHSAGGLGRVLAVTAEGAAISQEQAWQLLEAGASDILAWEDAAASTAMVLARLQRWQEIDRLVESPEVRQQLVGESHRWKSVLRRLVEVACFTEAPVLLLGETGTGKELAARLIHTLDSRRRQRELVIVDCTTIVPELSGSELFGHERGAFTGAVAARKGAFALADGGSLFLDEIGELPPGLQVQLLRVLQEKSYKRVGSNVWHQSDFRLLAATNRGLEAEVEGAAFRRDLYYRVASWTIRLPPLRERTEDIIPLVNHFWLEAQPDQERPQLDERVRAYFLTRKYPGNVRDLRNLVLRIAARHVGPGPVTIGAIPADERLQAPGDAGHWCDGTLQHRLRRALYAGVELREIKRTIQDMAIGLAVEEEAGSTQNAARRLGVSDRTVQKWRARRQAS